MSLGSMGSGKQSREAALRDWGGEALRAMTIAVGEDFSLAPASDDASFRRYFRGVVAGQGYIFVDAPPDKEDSRPFVQVASMLREADVNAPRVFAHDFELGFMLLTDLGEQLFFDVLASREDEAIEHHYQSAFSSLLRMQQIDGRGLLPFYDEAKLREEMGLFTEWFLAQQLGLETDAEELASIDAVFDLLVASALDQPQVFVHRDFHCRNLMVVPNADPGVIDFQDAVTGPVTYDLVSLLRDCYHRFDSATIERWVEQNRVAASNKGLIGDVDPVTFRRWFDWMGLQRHLKCAGIFSRLNLRDGKARYLADIPLVVDYIVEVCDVYEELAEFAAWMRSRVVRRLPRLREP